MSDPTLSREEQARQWWRTKPHWPADCPCEECSPNSWRNIHGVALEAEVRSLRSSREGAITDRDEIAEEAYSRGYRDGWSTRRPGANDCPAPAASVESAGPEPVTRNPDLAIDPKTGDYVWCRCGDAIRTDDAVCGNCHAPLLMDRAPPPPAGTEKP